MSRSNRMFEANAVRKTSKYSAVSVKPRFARISCNPWVACGMFLVDAYVNEIKGRSTSCKGDELSPSARMIGRIALCSAKPQAFSSHIPKTCLPLSFADLALTWQLWRSQCFVPLRNSVRHCRHQPTFRVLAPRNGGALLFVFDVF